MNKHYHDLFIDLDDTLYDTYGNSMIALRKLFDERQWQKVMPSFDAFREAYYETNHEVWEKYAHGKIDRDTLIVERFRQPVTKMISQCSGDTSFISDAWCVAVSDHYDTDIAGALHAGIDAILFNRWQIDVNSLDPQPQYAVNHLSEIKDILL